MCSSKILAGITPALALSFFAAGCSSSRHEQRSLESPPAAPAAIRVFAVAESQWPTIYEAVGTVRARSAAVVSARVMGYVREVKVKAADRVRAGEILVLLDSRDLDAQLRQAQATREEALSAIPEIENAVAAARANLELAQVTSRRMKELLDKRSVSNHEFDEASARLKATQASLAMALAKREQLTAKVRQADEVVSTASIRRGYAEVTAPFAGVVTDKRVEPGNLALPGAPLLTIEQAGAYRLEALVEESRSREMHTGRPTTVTLDSLGRTFTCRVSEIAPAIDAASRAFLVKIDLPPTEGLSSGLYGRARFTSTARQVLAIPAVALREQGQLRSVMVIDGNIARTRLITTGEKREEMVEVLSGLNPGERIASPAPLALADGGRVEVRQ